MLHSDDARQLIINSRKLLLEVSPLWTKNHNFIGYSHLVKTQDGLYNTKIISKRGADKLLEKDLIKISKQLTRLKVDEHLSQNQFDALVCLVYDIGIQSFRGSELPKLLKQRKYIEASSLFRKWNKYEKSPKYQLIDSRQKEIQLFNKGYFDKTRKQKHR